MAAVAADQRASENFVSVHAGTMPVTQLFDSANLARYLAGAHSAGVA